MFGMKLLIAVLVVLVVFTNAFVQNTRSRVSSLSMALSDYKDELAKTAAALAGPGNHHNFIVSIIDIIS